MSEPTERTPLSQGQPQQQPQQPAAPEPNYQQYEYGYEDDYEEDSLMDNKVFRYSMYALGVLAIPLIYLFVVYLPNLIPPAESIDDIAVAGKSPVFLHPVVRPAGTPAYAEQDVEGELDWDEDEDMDLEGEMLDMNSDWFETLSENLKAKRLTAQKKTNGKKSSSGRVDSEDPIKKVPDFSNWQYLDEKSKAYQEHLTRLPAYTANQTAVKRMIMIGDIHGSLKQLLKLLDRIHYNRKEDEVVMLGDFLGKGKNSLGVMDWAVENNVSCVLGNHEMEILKRYVQLHGLPRLTFVGRHGEQKHIPDTVSAQETYDMDDLMRIAKHLTPHHIQYLRRCPLVQELGPVPHLTNRRQTKYFEYPAEGYAVHAGLLWTVPNVADQDPVTVTEMRSLLPPNWTIPTEDRHKKIDGVKGRPWSKLWNLHIAENVTREMKNMSSTKLTLGKKVYYGHDAGRGLTIRPYSTGLDSGCVYGLALSSEIVWAEAITNKTTNKQEIVYKHQFVQVNC